MSVHSASQSPLQLAANGETDEANMPKGHCRYILLLPEIRGQRCACVSFSLNKGIPGATCECGHLACFHNKEPDATTDQKQELELLKSRIQNLEHQLSKGHEEVLDSVVSRLNEVQEHLDKGREEFGEQIKGAYRNVSLSWRSIEQVERKNQQQDDQLRQIYERLKSHDEQLDRLHAGQLELRDADLSLEERIENLTETLEEEEEWRLAAASLARRPRRRSTSDTSSRPVVPLAHHPLGSGAAPSDNTSYLRPAAASAGGPITTTTTSRQPTTTTHPAHSDWPAPATTHLPQPQLHPHPIIAPRSPPASAPSTGAWTVHISLLPHASVPMPFERNTNAYQRCLSRGLHQMVAVRGRDAYSFRKAVEKVFGRFLRGREWIPLQAKLCDAGGLWGLPMLRQLEGTLLEKKRRMKGDGEAGEGEGAGEWWTPYTHEFLKTHCAVCDAGGVIDSLYIAMRPPHSLSWHTLRHAPVYMEGLEECWRYDELLDSADPFFDEEPLDGTESMDGVEGCGSRPAAGDVTLLRTAAAGNTVGGGGGVKRPLSEMSRSGSFSVPAEGTTQADGAVAAGTGTGTVVVGDEARVKRACPVVPSKGKGKGSAGAPIVEIRRRDIKTA